jgi:hypothetical protein
MKISPLPIEQWTDFFVENYFTEVARSTVIP